MPSPTGESSCPALTADLTRSTNRAPVCGGGGLSREAVAETQCFWQERTGEALSDEDAREAIRNVSAFFDLLHEWDTDANGKLGATDSDGRHVADTAEGKAT